MANVLKELAKAFSFRTAIRSNILSSSYTPIGVGGSTMTNNGLRNNENSTFNTFTSSRLLTSWYQKMEESKNYENTELSNIVIGIYADYISNYFNNSEEVVSFTDTDEKAKHYERVINKIFKQISLVDTIKDHLKEIIYYGSYSIKVDWDKVNRRWIKYELANPYNVVTVKRHGVPKFHVVMTKSQKILQVSPNSILRFGSAGLKLVNDISEDFFKSDEEKEKTKLLVEEDTIINNYDLSGGAPLYYNLMGKVKEYLLKDQIVSILSIKDLIQPLLLLIRVNKATDPTEANKLAVNTENLINKYSDLSALFGANFSISDLMDSILNNIRVLPDYESAMGDMNSIDLSKISNKIQEIKQDQDNSKESIYTSFGIPRALSVGDTTKWEAIKSSQRLNSKVASLIESINSSVRVAAATFYYLLTKQSIDPEQIKVNLFAKTDVDYNTSIVSAEIVSQLIEAINRVLESVQRFVQDNKIVNIESYVNYVVKQLKVIDPDIIDFLDDATLRTYIQEAIKDRTSTEPSGRGGFYSSKVTVNNRSFSLKE